MARVQPFRTDIAASADVIVIGAGMVGSALACGIAATGAKTLVLDEGDDAIRAARGNFGLIWTQTKGLGLQRYQDWTRESAALYPAFARELGDATTIDIGHEQRGGLILCLSDAEMQETAWRNQQMEQQSGNVGYGAEMVERREIEAMLPGVRLGPDVVGGSFSPHDGQVGPLNLLRAMHARFQQCGARYVTNARVETIEPVGSAFRLVTPAGSYATAKVVIACGHGIPRLASQVGMQVPTYPQRGQILVTEKLRRMLPIPMGSIRQTAEGSVMLGVSHEDVGFDDRTIPAVTEAIAARAVRILPELSSVGLVRTWGALRVMPPDGFPIYQRSESHPGAFAVTMHSGVTLAAVHARRLPEWIVEHRAPEDFDRFSLARFAETADAAAAS